MIRELMAVGFGGAAGSIVRYLLSGGILAGQTLLGFPAGTFTVNAAGSLLIGILLEAQRLRDAGLAAHRGILRRLHHLFDLFGRHGAPAAGRMLQCGGDLCGAERRGMHRFCSARHVDRNDI